MRRVVLLLLLAGCAMRSAIAQPPLAFAPESAFIPTPRFIQLSTYNVSEPAQSGTVFRVDDYGAAGDGIVDDTTPMNSAVAVASAAGGTVVFTAGKTYRKTGLVTVSGANVTLWGYGATIYADAGGSTSPDLAFKLTGTGDNVFGLTVISNLAQRVSNTSSSAFWLTGDNQAVIDSRIEYTGTCAFVQGTHFFIGRNICYRDWADGFTVAGGVSCACAIDHGHIVGNIVRQNGDDMISVINYADTDDEEPFISDITIEYNDLGDSYGGGGIHIGGGKNITIRFNRIGPDPCVVGIQIDSQVSFLTRNVSNVLVTDNDISDVQVTAPPYLPAGHSCALVDHGVLYINAAGQSGVSHHITGVLYQRNRISRALRKGVQVQQTGTPAGVVTNVGYQTTRLVGVQGTPMSVGSSGVAVCTDNQVVDLLGATATGCGTGAMPTVTGSSYLTR